VRIVALDHLVLTVADVGATVSFYEKLGMRSDTFGDGRIALRFGEQKINLHQSGAEVTPNAAIATPGSADVCFLVANPIEEVLGELASAGIDVELGPVARTGATSALTSVYVRDPDGNLVELAQTQSLPAADDSSNRHLAHGRGGS
jgi:catechol 2,3-dioxygenase-like lactoylglutathione lyase family enzyme